MGINQANLLYLRIVVNQNKKRLNCTLSTFHQFPT